MIQIQYAEQKENVNTPSIHFVRQVNGVIDFLTIKKTEKKRNRKKNEEKQNKKVNKTERTRKSVCVCVCLCLTERFGREGKCEHTTAQNRAKGRSGEQR